MDISRRSLLRLTGGAALASAVPGLAACGDGAGTSVGNAGKSLAPLPAHIPINLVKPDLPGTAQGVQDAFLTYPQKPAQTVDGKPGDGSVVTCMVITYGTAPSPAASNKLWTAINEALGVDLRLTLVPAADLNAKYATMMAGGDLPDIIATIDVAMSNALQFTQAKCADLTEYISGDAIKDYPNLANLPTISWQNVGRIGGRLYGIPVPRPQLAGVMFGNREKFEAAGIRMGLGVSTAQFTEGLAKLATGKQFPLGGNNFSENIHLGAAGVPSNWVRADGGAFTSRYENPVYPEVLQRLRDWYEKGYFYPDLLSTQATQANTFFMNGTTLTLGGGIGGYPGMVSGVGDAFTVDFVRPYGDNPTPWLGNGVFSNSGRGGFTALKKASPERVKMLLRVLNFLAAPFGSKEYELINYGVAGVHFTTGADGDPLPTALATTGGENKTNLPLQYIAAAPYVLYLPGNPDATRRSHQAQQEIVPIGVGDPSYGLVSPTQAAKGTKLNQQIIDVTNAIIAGKRPVSDWRGAVSQWKSQGGDAIAKELAEQYAANH
ncbi:extracellular solute-binding protein [Nonomuraea sp. NPDC005650]|uniref:extracellular solute-binding protein n=1 Tax=Nonomuraea sp. NPDC005650 TaxID=3157045 RepID=UPI0033A44271